MTDTLDRKEEKQQGAEASRAPHLSYSRVQRYLVCPEQYRLYYIEGLRAEVESASLAFGAVVHLALAELFRNGVEPATTFKQEWQAPHGVELRFSRKETWESVSQKGEALLQKFCREHAKKIGKVISVEKVFELGLSNVKLPFIGVIDLIAEMDGKRTLVEFKTAAADYEDDEVALLDPLTSYQLADPDAEQATACVLVKTQKPRIEWHGTRRTPEQVIEYLDKLEIVSHQIEHKNFYKRPGKWCRQCEFLPLCLGDSQRAKATPVQIV